MKKIKVIYRISDAGYKKEKPEYITNSKCLGNFMYVFRDHAEGIIIADNCSEETVQTIMATKNDSFEVHHVSIGSGGGTFKYALEYLLEDIEPDDVVYFVENDYVHKPLAPYVLIEGLERADYVTLYDHPDKFLNPMLGGNPQVEDGGELTRVILTKSSHWKLTNSTTMTFAAMGKTLHEDAKIMLPFISGSYPRDYEMFLALRANGRSLISSIPGYSTHGETRWLSPLTDWNKI